MYIYFPVDLSEIYMWLTVSVLHLSYLIIILHSQKTQDPKLMSEGKKCEWMLFLFCYDQGTNVKSPEILLKKYTNFTLDLEFTVS